MSLIDVIDASILLIKGAIILAVIIRDKEKIDDDLKLSVNILSMELTVAGGLLNRLKRVVNQVNAQDESTIKQQIDILNKSIRDAQERMEDVARDRNFIKRLFMRQDDYRRDIRALNDSLHRICVLIEGTIPRINRIQIAMIEFRDFRRQFRETPEKRLYFYDIFTIRDGPKSAVNEFDERKSVDNFDKNASCYMTVSGEQIIFSHQLRAWCAATPKDILLARRLEEFRLHWHRDNLRGSNSSLDSVASTDSLPKVPRPLLVPRTTLTSPEKSVSLDFSELFMAQDDICGIVVTNEYMYVATDFEITIVSLINQQIIAQIGSNGEGNNTFKKICYLYIPGGDEDNHLYVVDRGQRAVHLYKFDDGGRRLEFVRRFLIIAELPEEPKLVSCVTFNRRLYVSDDTNNCLHLFSLQAQNQSHCLRGDAITPFVPGSLCVSHGYLYVANCAHESPSILVFDEKIDPAAWFRNAQLKHILAMSVCPKTNELFVLSITDDPQDTNTQKRLQKPVIVSMNPSTQSK